MRSGAERCSGPELRSDDELCSPAHVPNPARLSLTARTPRHARVSAYKSVREPSQRSRSGAATSPRRRAQTKAHARQEQKRSQPPKFGGWLSFRAYWSGRLDSNQRPPAPHAGALPDCATARHALKGPHTYETPPHGVNCFLAIALFLVTYPAPKRSRRRGYRPRSSE